MSNLINQENIREKICAAWAAVQSKVEAAHPLSSEKTLCFLFLWEFGNLFSNRNNIHFDFESQPYSHLRGKSKFLDLLIYSDPDYKVAIEFKLPQRSSTGNSNQTQTRQAIYRDLARLRYLVENRIDNIKCAFFLCATNEAPYCNQGNLSELPNLKTYHDFTFRSCPVTVIDGLTVDFDIRFLWEGIETRSGKNSIAGRYAWLRPLCFVPEQQGGAVKLHTL